MLAIFRDISIIDDLLKGYNEEKFPRAERNQKEVSMRLLNMEM